MTELLIDKARRLTGRQVVITLSARPTVQVVGTLVNAEPDGDVTYLNAEGRLNYAWPMLEVEERYHPRMSMHA